MWGLKGRVLGPTNVRGEGEGGVEGHWIRPTWSTQHGGTTTATATATTTATTTTTATATATTTTTATVAGGGGGGGGWM